MRTLSPIAAKPCEQAGWSKVTTKNRQTSLLTCNMHIRNSDHPAPGGLTDLHRKKQAVDCRKIAMLVRAGKRAWTGRKCQEA